MKNQFLAISLVLIGLIQGCKQEVIQWRGDDRNGIYNETDLLDQWPENGPELLWQYEGLGRGYAAPIVSKDKLFVNGEQEGNSYLFAFDLEGDLLWKSPNGKEFLGEGFSATYPGARSTPTIAGDYVYTSSGQGRIACFEASTGIEKWAVSIVEDFDAAVAWFGYSESLPLDKDNVYCFPGGEEMNMAALDRYTGETVWTSEVLRDTFAYGSPVLVDLPSRKVLITSSRHHIFTVDRSNGELLSSYKVEGYEIDGEHCNSPVYSDGYIYFIGNDEKGKGAVKLKLSQDAKSLNEIWFNKEIRNNFDGYVKIGNHLFTTVKGNWLKVLELEGGTVVDSIKAATGSLIYADEKFICYGNNGTVNLINYSQEKLEIAGTLKIKEGTGHHFSHPVLADGVMYIRRGNALMAYQIK